MLHMHPLLRCLEFIEFTLMLCYKSAPVCLPRVPAASHLAWMYPCVSRLASETCAPRIFARRRATHPKPKLSDNDHSFNQLPEHKALTCPKGQNAWAVAPPWLAKETRSMQQKKLVNVFRSDLLPLDMKRSCICAGQEMWFTQDECVMRTAGCCFVEQVCLMWLLREDE